jgi:hypothetical protein
MRSIIEIKLNNKFLEIYSKHHNPIWATDELTWLVLNKHCHEFEKLNEFDQWEIRNLLGAFAKLYK